MADRTYSHILVPTDFAPDRRAAYRVAVAAATGTGAAVTLLHVAPTPRGGAEDEYRGLDAIRLMHRSAEGWVGWEPSPEVVAAQNAELERRLRVEALGADAGGVDVRCAVRRGDPETEITRFTREEGVDLIVVADSPPGLLPRLSRPLADRLAREASVEVVRVIPAGPPARQEAVAT